jgi:uncharacterized protein (DUF2267 family)
VSAITDTALASTSATFRTMRSMLSIEKPMIVESKLVHHQVEVSSSLPEDASAAPARWVPLLKSTT